MSEEKQYCYWKNEKYSEGSETCQEGFKKKCEDGRWVDTGESCSKDSDSSIAERNQGIDLSWVKDATDEEKVASQKVSVEDSYADLATVRKIRRYAEVNSVVKVSPYIYFSGRATRSQFCSLVFLNYRMYLRDLTETSDILQCEGIFYRVLEFEVEEET